MSVNISVGDPNAYEVVADAEAAPDDWLHARRSLVTASEVPIVLGLYGSPLKLWYEKKGLLEREDFSDNEAVAMGHTLEEPNAKLFAEKTGRRLTRQQVLLRSRAYPWLGATLDYSQHDESIGGPPVPLECKSTGRKDLWPEDAEPHLRYQAQLQSQIIVTASTWGSLSAIIGAPYLHHRWRDYEAHAGFAGMLLTETEKFFESLAKGIPPSPDDREETGWALRHAALDALSGATVPLPSIAAEWHEKLEATKRDELECKRQRRYFENLLSAAIGTATRGRLPDGSAYTFPVIERQGYTVQPTSYRQLRWVKK